MILTGLLSGLVLMIYLKLTNHLALAISEHWKFELWSSELFNDACKGSHSKVVTLWHCVY